MSRNGSGSMSIPNTFTAGTTAVAADVNENFEDIGDEITNSVAADGQTSMTGALKAFAGTEALPGLSFATDTDTGIRRSAANTLAVVCNANDVVTVEAAEVTLESGVDLTVTAGDTTLTDGNLVMTSGAVDFSAAVDVASAATANIGAAASNTVNMTGTETITSLGTAAAGVERWVKFNGATLTHNATSLILPGAANITTAAGDTALFKSEGEGNWRCYGYQRANGKAVGWGYRTFIEETAPSTPASGTVSLYAKSDGKLYSKDDAGDELQVSALEPVTGDAPVFGCRAWVNFNGSGTVAIRESGNVDSITDNGTGDYTINFATDMPDANYAVAITCAQSNPGGSLTGYVVDGTMTVGSVRIRTNFVNSGASASINPSYVGVAIFR